MSDKNIEIPIIFGIFYLLEYRILAFRNNSVKGNGKKLR